MKRIVLIAALAAFSAPALADGQRTATEPAPALGLKAQVAKPARAKDALDRMDDLEVKRCNEDGGGASTGEDGSIHCTDPDGNELW
jgi:hypothetical protein